MTKCSLTQKTMKRFWRFFCVLPWLQSTVAWFWKEKAGGVVAAAVAVVPIDLDRYGHGALPLRRRLNWSVTTTTTTTIWIFLWIGADKKSFKTLKRKKSSWIGAKIWSSLFCWQPKSGENFHSYLKFFQLFWMNNRIFCILKVFKRCTNAFWRS